ncbi:MAG: rod shape-determining protein MreC [Bacteroidales bacterium]|nr:rod shape-determining protein MreC [Bacteroidales bacterium]
MSDNRIIRLLKDYDYVWLFLLLVAASLVLVSRTGHYQGSRLLAWSNALAGRWYGGVHGVSGYFGLRTENARLAAENALLREQMAASYISYADTVFEIHDTVYRQQYTYTEAQVIKNTWSQQNNYIMVGKGRANGIMPDQAVISPDGIVGVVVSVSRHFATVMPVLHGDSRNSVKVKRTGISGSLVWDGRDYRYAQVIDVPTTHQFVEGDTIVTSGLAGDFPEGIPVGYVESAETLSGSGFYRVKIRLATDFNKLANVYIIDNRFREEQQQLTAATMEEHGQ